MTVALTQSGTQRKANVKVKDSRIYQEHLTNYTVHKFNSDST